MGDFLDSSVGKESACNAGDPGIRVVMYGRGSWTIKKAEHRKIDAFELWCWRRLESPLDCKEVQPVHPKGNLS